MNLVEILSVGDEVISGQITDTNAAYLSRKLSEMGFSVRFHQSCGDEMGEIVSTMRLALSRSDLVIVTGGLGPTYDDITRDAASIVFDSPLEPSAAAEAQIRSYFARRGIPMSENNLLQAKAPRCAEILENLWGTAPALHLSGKAGEMFLLPGVPGEMKILFETYIVPFLDLKREGERESRSLLLYGISESRLDEMMRGVSWQEGVIVSPYAESGQIRLQITSFAKTKEEAVSAADRAEECIFQLVGEHVFGVGGTCLEQELVRALKQKSLSIATAESCTGGRVSSRITSVSGASEVFSLGVCAYSEEEKKRLLSVGERTLEEDGVYSLRCAEEMAKGICKLSGADLGIATSGIAGPSGGTEENPVGTVYFAVCSKSGVVSERRVFGTGHYSREQIASLAASHALFMALSVLKQEEVTENSPDFRQI